MAPIEAQRRLVKSPPELWAEISDPDALGKHLESFGEIEITRVDPETTVAWEGEKASGTVSIEGSGWGTKVVLRAQPAVVELESEPEEIAAEHEPLPEEAGDDPEAGDTVAFEPFVPRLTPDPADWEPDEAIPAFPDADPAPDAPADPLPRRGFFARLFGRRYIELVPEISDSPPPFGEIPDSPPPAEPEIPDQPAPQPEIAPVPDPDPLPDPDPQPDPQPDPEPTHDPVRAPDRLPQPDPEPPLMPAARSTAPAVDTQEAQALLESALDSLGSAHHRPFSRG